MLCKFFNYFYRRFNNLAKYLQAIIEIQKKYEEIPKIYFYTRNNKPNIFLKYQKQIAEGDTSTVELQAISNDSYVSEPILAIEKCNISKSVIGPKFSISESSTVKNSVLFENVSIGKG